MTLEFPNTNEGHLQAFCYRWFANNFPEMRELLQSVPNESKRSPAYANRLKAMGLTPGALDMAFHFRKTTAFLEFKEPGGKLSEDQERVIAKLRKQGFEVYIIRDFVAFQKSLEDSFGANIWRDLMRVHPADRTVYGEIMPKEWSVADLVDASGLDVNVWEGFNNESDIVKLSKADAAVLASRLVLDSTGNKTEIVERVLKAFRAMKEEKTKLNNDESTNGRTGDEPGTDATAGESGGPAADAVDPGSNSVSIPSLDMADKKPE